MKFFDNKFPDYIAGSSVEVNKDSWVTQILQLTESIVQGMPASPDYCDGGLYVGNAGIAYMFYCLSKNDAFEKQRSTFLENAVMYCSAAQDYLKTSGSDEAAFLLGEAGIQAVSSLVHEAIGSSSKANKYAERYASIAETCLPIDFLRCGSDELLVGRAGYLCGALNLNRKLGRQVVSDSIIQKVCAVVVASGRRSTQNNKSVPLMYAYYDTEYLGAAHGLSSILQMLMSFPAVLKSDKETESVVHVAVDFMLSLEQDNFNYAPAMDEVSRRRPEKEELVHWCHGAPGVVYMLARAYKLWGDVKYLDACMRCGDLVWEKGLLRKGPGICHGIAGSGYVFLLLYRLTGDQKHLYRAVKFSEFLFASEFQQARIPDSPYSLYEGWAGTVCFLADLLQPDRAEFPFFDVFVD